MSEKEQDPLDMLEIENDNLDEHLEILNSAEDDSKQEEEDSYVDIANPSWTETCLDMLSENEKHKGRPRVAGLRRIFYGIFGRPKRYSADLPVLLGDRYVVRFVIIDRDGHEVAGIADAYSDNTNFPYNTHLNAMAETRAEGRALVKYMNLSINAAEELTDAEDDEQNSPEQKGPIKDNQIVVLKNICSRKDVNLKEFASKMLGKDYNSITEMSYGDAQTLLVNINGDVDLSEFIGYSEGFFEK